jgi:thiosulfate/3-mercaptopyruvate sulfurtransferase
MVDDLSSPSGSIPYGLPPAESIARLLSSFGVTGDDTIVLYGAGPQSVVHRCWWVLTASGARDVRVLDGGWERWRNEGRPVESAPPRFKPGTFAGNPKPDIKADRDDVVGALGNSKSCLVHALTAEQFAGTGGQVYGKPGRIPGSVHVPVQSVVDAATNRLRPIAELEELFSATGADKADVVIPYCGGGIAASTIFLALSLVGYDNVRLYDGSLLDWTADPDAPMVTDANAASAN